MAKYLGIPKKAYVYALVDPNDQGKIRYVGIAENPQTRYANHFNSSRNYRMKMWIQDLAFINDRPELRILNPQVPLEEARELEKWSIAKYSANDLFNICDNREASKEPILVVPTTDETIKKLKQKAKRLKLDGIRISTFLQKVVEDALREDQCAE